MANSRDTPEDSCLTILNSIEEGVFTVDLKWRITSFNRAAEYITGISRDQAIGRPCYEVFCTDVCQKDCVLSQALKENRPVFNIPVFMRRADSRRSPIIVNASVLRDANGNTMGGVETFRDLTACWNLEKTFHQHYSFENMVSNNEKMLKIFSNVKLIADSECTVLIEGATGTGKELLAQAVHNNSPQKNGPFVPVNCGALPATLIESELFGYKAGAFTDAKTDKPGRFDRAQNGTIFLDEIEDIPKAMQIRLLRVLENKVYEPLGAIQPIKFNARVVVASKCDLDKLVEEKKFREDLYFRVNVIKLTLPRLAERKDDIPLLVDHFIQQCQRGKKKKNLELSQEAMAALMLYDWPGNIRELENAIEHACVLCQNNIINLSDLPAKVLEGIDVSIGNAGRTLKEIEKTAILYALRRNNWKKAVTACELGINKNTLRRKIVSYQIDKQITRLHNER